MLSNEIPFIIVEIFIYSSNQLINQMKDEFIHIFDDWIYRYGLLVMAMELDSYILALLIRDKSISNENNF